MPKPETSDSNSDLADFLDDHHEGAVADLNDSSAQIGSRIADARIGQGFDQEALAASLGVTTLTLRDWESGAAIPRGNRLTMMAGLLGVSLSWLMIGRGAEPAGGEISQLRGSLVSVRRQLVDALAEIDQVAERLASLEE